MSLHVYTYFTDRSKAKYLFETARFHNVEVTNLAKSQEWKGFYQRLLAMKETIEPFPDDDIVCFIDSYDLIVNADKDTIIRKFKEANCELLFGAETNLHPPILKTLNYPNSTTIFRYLNAGTYIGYVRAIKQMLLWKPIEGDDQEYANRYFLEYNQTRNIKLDHETKFSLNMQGILWDVLEIVNGYVDFPPLNTTPCFIHFNGMSYLDINKDMIRNGNELQFNYYAVYDRTFSAILGSKMLTRSCDVICKLTGKGMTY